jgi:hypothetical protein
MLHVFLTYSALYQAPLLRALLVSTSCHLTSAFAMLGNKPSEIVCLSNMILIVHFSSAVNFKESVFFHT